MCSEFHLELRKEILNDVYMNLEHKSLRTWTMSGQYYVVYRCYSALFRRYLRTV